MGFRIENREGIERTEWVPIAGSRPCISCGNDSWNDERACSNCIEETRRLHAGDWYVVQTFVIRHEGQQHSRTVTHGPYKESWAKFQMGLMEPGEEVRMVHRSEYEQTEANRQEPVLVEGK